jgi:hypothetical protein
MRGIAMRRLRLVRRLALAGACLLLCVSAWSKVSSSGVRKVFEEGLDSLVKASGDGLTQEEKKQIVDETWREIQGSSHLYTEAEARLFVSSLREELSRNSPSGASPDSTVRKLNVRKQILLIQSHMFFFEALLEKGIAIPSPDRVVLPFADILKRVTDEHLGAIRESLRKAMVESFVASRTGILENALVPSGKREPSPEELKSFGEQMDSEAKKLAQGVTEDRAEGETSENWESNAALHPLYISAIRLWSRYTWIKDVVDMNDPKIRESMENNAKAMKEMDEKIAEEQKRQRMDLKKCLDGKMAQFRQEKNHRSPERGHGTP